MFTISKSRGKWKSLAAGKVVKSGKADGLFLKRVLTGGAVGAATSLLGGGGGMLAVPLLKGLNMSERSAHATAILVILPVSALSFLLYALKGYCDFSVLIPVAVGVSLGGEVGALLLNKLPERGVQITFAVLQAAAGIWLIWK